MQLQTDWEPRYARRAERMRASEIRELLKLLDEPGIISFAGGIPDPALFPVETARAAYAEALVDGVAGQALQYSVSEGYLPLREWIVAHMNRLGVPCTADNILITSGSQQALEFLGRLLLTAGDTALVTAPTYLGALQAFSAYEPRYDELRPEHGNRTPDAYRHAAAENGGEVKFAYIVPDFANPTGETPRARACSISPPISTSRSWKTPPTPLSASRASRYPAFSPWTSPAPAASMPRASSTAAPSPRHSRLASAPAGSAPAKP
jgi:DNA-binding transcriptional MocR family regulator